MYLHLESCKIALWHDCNSARLSNLKQNLDRVKLWLPCEQLYWGWNLQHWKQQTRKVVFLEANSLYLRKEFGDMTYWPTDSERFNVLHFDDESSLLVMGEDLTNSPSNILKIPEQHTGQLSHLFTYGGSLTGSQASSSRLPLFGNARRKGGVLAKIIPTEITHKNVKGPPTFQELVADIFWKKRLMWFTFSPRRELHLTIHL